jgi:hypothetical protein
MCLSTSCPRQICAAQIFNTHDDDEIQNKRQTPGHMLRINVSVDNDDNKALNPNLESSA